MSVQNVYEAAQKLNAQQRPELIRLLQAEVPPRFIPADTADAMWTAEELAEFDAIQPMTGAEIVASGVIDIIPDFPNSTVWKDQIRQYIDERTKW
jgi:hypothetical protein